MINFSDTELLTFDCYGTLIDWENGIFSALRPVLAAHGKSIADADLLALYGEFEANAEAGEYRPYREVLQSVVRSFGQRLGFDPTQDETPVAARLSLAMAALARHRSCAQATLRSLPAGHHFKHRRRIVCPHARVPAGKVRGRHHGAASALLQAGTGDFSAGSQENRGAAQPNIARGAERLSRRAARAIS